MHAAATLSRFLVTVENRAAWLAIHDVVGAFQARTPDRLALVVLVHGPGGTGKTHLCGGLVKELTRCDAARTIQQISANDWKTLLPPPPPKEFKTANVVQQTEGDALSQWLDEARGCDLLVIEDAHHLPARAAEALVQLLDTRQAQQLPTLLTARYGPRQLGLPARLTTRLAGGLVVGIEPLQAPSRLQLLQEFAQRRQLAVDPAILQWLAAHLTGGGRQLEGAIGQIDTLSRLQRQPLRLADIRPHFRAQVDALRPSVERIVQHVGRHFHVQPEEMLSRRRLRAILVPRQIGMYLARRLTGLSLKQIGTSFGGHDHTTVLHACRKIERAVQHDALFGGAVRQLHAELA